MAKHPAARAFALACLGLVALALGGCGTSPFASLDVRAPRLGERECLARAMYFESNRSSEDGMLAVGTVVMNRVEDRRYPKSICGVVGQPGQFAEGALSKPVSPRLMARAEQVADAVIGGKRHAGAAHAQHFHTAGLSYPYRNMHYVLLAGGNAFYEKRTPGTFRPATPAEKGIVATQFARAAPTPASRPIQVARAEPVREKPVALAFAPPASKPKPIVLAMLSERSRVLPPPRSIADLIAMDAKRR